MLPSVLVKVFQRNRTNGIEKKVYKELTHMIMGAGKSKICRADVSVQRLSSRKS